MFYLRNPIRNDENYSRGEVCRDRFLDLLTSDKKIVYLVERINSNTCFVRFCAGGRSNGANFVNPLDDCFFKLILSGLRTGRTKSETSD